MKFSKLKTKLVKHTLEFKFLAKTSRDELKTKDTWFLSLTDEKGITGIGECSIIPGLSIENPEAFERKLNHVAENFSEYENYHESLVKFPAIRFGIETALLDLKTGGKRELFPTDFTLKQKPLSINGLVWMGDRAFMSSQVKEKIAAGFNCIKLKIGALDFEQELDIIKSIRNEYSANDIEIRVDANGAFSLDDALEKLVRLSELDLHSIEQPIKQGQIDEMAALCMFSPLDIALDEELIGIHSIEKKRELLEIIQPQYIILKPSLLGGFKASEEWISLAKKNDISYWNTSALEANIGLNAISQWTSSLNNSLPQGLGTGGLYSNNIDSPLTVKNGEIYYDRSQDWDLKDTK